MNRRNPICYIARELVAAGAAPPRKIRRARPVRRSFDRGSGGLQCTTRHSADRFSHAMPRKSRAPLCVLLLQCQQLRSPATPPPLRIRFTGQGSVQQRCSWHEPPGVEHEHEQATKKSPAWAGYSAAVPGLATHGLGYSWTEQFRITTNHCVPVLRGHDTTIIASPEPYDRDASHCGGET